MSNERKSDMIELTALWLSEAASGEQYLSGMLGATRVMIFKNKFKKAGSKEPDYRVYLAPQQKPEKSNDPDARDPLPF